MVEKIVDMEGCGGEKKESGDGEGGEWVGMGGKGEKEVGEVGKR